MVRRWIPSVGKMRTDMGLPRVRDLLPGVGTWPRDACRIGLVLLSLKFYI